MAYFFSLDLRLWRLFIYSKPHYPFTAIWWAPTKPEQSEQSQRGYFFPKDEWKTRGERNKIIFKKVGKKNHRAGNYTSIYKDVQNLNNTLHLKSISETEAHQLSSENTAVLLYPRFACSVSFRDALCQHIRKHSPSLLSEISSVELSGINLRLSAPKKNDVYFKHLNTSLNGCQWV